MPQPADKYQIILPTSLAERSKKMKKNAFKLWGLAGGVGVGLLNGLLGAGGGMVLVPLLELFGINGKKSHATSLAIIVPLSAVSAGFYLYKDWLHLTDALPYLPGGILGALLGVWLLQKLNISWLKIAFGLLLLWGGARNLWIG